MSYQLFVQGPAPGRLKVKVLVTQSCPLFAIPWTEVHQASCPWNSLGKNTGVGSHSLLQGIFLIQESNLGLLHCRQILYYLSHLGSSGY